MVLASGTKGPDPATTGEARWEHRTITTPEVSVPESHELSTQQCEALLRVGMVGRVAFSTPAGPHMVTVNYTVVDDAVVLRTSPYSLLGTHGRNTVVAFGVDGFDDELERGWSVQARGRMEVVTAHQELDHIREVADPRPWATGVRALYLRLHWTELSGRQLGGNWNRVPDVPVSPAS
jgi:nitroimidazol reductase NimA-like FMN-containing flavoprotein (pyridoxamine 5'-phosphate oxidase superfamily)